MITVKHLFHTPVKSLAVSEVAELELGPNGVVGDRSFFLLGDDGRSLNAARRLPLCQASATFSEGQLTILLPDGTSVTGPTDSAERLTVGWDMKSEIDAYVVPGPWREALSEFAREPVRLARVADERGGWSGFSVSLIGTPSIDALGLGPIDSRRFRMLIQTAGGAPFVEDGWVGRDVRVGNAVIHVDETCARCAVTTCDPDTGERDVDTLRAMIDAKGSADLGIYGSVVEPGLISVGDTVELL